MNKKSNIIQNKIYVKDKMKYYLFFSMFNLGKFHLKGLIEIYKVQNLLLNFLIFYLNLLNFKSKIIFIFKNLTRIRLF